MIKSIIQAEADRTAQISAAMNIDYLASMGYNVSQGEIKIRSGCLDKIVNSVKNSEICNFSSYNYNILVRGPEIYLHITKEEDKKKEKNKITSPDGSLYIYAKNNSEIKNWLETNKEYIILCDSRDNISVKYFYKASYGIEKKNLELNSGLFNKIYPELYPDINIDKLNESFLASKEPILLLYGRPGVGKTTFLKYFILKDRYKNICYTKDTNVVNDTSFWSTLTENNFDAIVLDDLNFGISSSSENNNFVSNLLSYSDGIFENSSKIIITTNKKVEEIDSAILRPQRCFDFLILNDLSYSAAMNFWKDTLKMSEKSFTKIYPKIANITQASLISNYEKSLNNNVERLYLRGNNRLYTIEQKLASVGISVHDEQRKLGI